MPEHLPAGKAGLVIATLRVDGIINGPNGMIAIVSNTQDRVYFLRDGDRLYDGEVEKISMEGVSFHQIRKRSVRQAGGTRDRQTPLSNHFRRTAMKTYWRASGLSRLFLVSAALVPCLAGAQSISPGDRYCVAGHFGCGRASCPSAESRP